MLSDIRVACRTLARRAVFSVSTTLMLAVAIAGGLVVHALADAVLFRSYPFPQPERLVVIYARDQSPSANPGAQRGSAGAQEVGLSIPDLEDFRRLARTLSGFAAITPFGANFTGAHTPVRIRGASVSWNFFDVVGARMALGAGFSTGDNAMGGNRSVVLTHAFWSGQLGSDTAAVGRELLLNGLPYRIAGVLDPTFVSLTGEDYDLYRAATPPALTVDRATRFWPAIARLQGSDVDAARAELATIAADLARSYPDTNRNFSVAVHRLSDLTPRDVRLALLFLLAAVALQTTVTCANVANLQVVYAAARSDEVSIRVTLGASSWRLLRQSTIEGLVLAMVAGVAGLLLSTWGLDVLKRAAPPMPGLDSAVIGVRAVIVCAMATVAIGLALGLAPWSQIRWYASVGNGGGRVIGSKRRASLMHRVAVAQVGAAVLLAGAATLMLLSFQRLLRIDPGFRTDNILTFHVPLAGGQSGLSQPAERFAAFQSELASVHGVEALGATLQLPLAGVDVDLTQLAVAGAPSVPAEQEPAVRLHVVTPGYFRAIGARWIRGRDFTDADTARAPATVIVNEAMARRLWPHADPLGRRLTHRLTFTPGENSDRTVVGIVGNIKHFGLHFVDEPQMYIPHAQSPWPAMSFVVRSAVPPRMLIPALRTALARVDPTVPMDAVQTMEDIVAASTREAQFRTMLVTIYAAGCVLLAFVGLYAVMAHSVSRRLRELGLRIAIGATRVDIVRMVLAEGGRVVLIGSALGFAGLVVVAKLVGSLLFGVSLFEPFVILGTAVVCLASTVMACAIPAYRAARVDPAISLRAQ